MPSDLLDLLEPAGRRSGCCPTSPVLFSSPSGVAGPAADETLLLCGRVVGTEVGIPFGAIKPEF
jgi:hypothetical protein